ncbi:DEAD/DEAH box helicase [Blastococcus sp. PRF04-17]|uniref:DEAD/DEAH box helicase n=1 Tax=Blastococcus sp. PRF04-17 TaxID=2933797 RepID=UPI001FF3B232|nr:DEAD/DEAH box helicase family protein [Blastococcus sp. PRF04-17]UOY01647.1 DEAD/DEAH box helicase family protein [Blastococcus sp. PRF04-17]
MSHPTVPFDQGLIDDIAARLELRTPNAEALSAVAKQLDGAAGSSVELVCDLATAVGKTYLAAGLIEYLAESGVRNVLFVTPGRTILDKTVANFTDGHKKSVLGGMATRPTVITVENFNTGDVATALADEETVKVFVFNVQALTKPDKATRRTRKFQEWLGEDLYAYLQGRDDLVVIADEHHVYSESAEAFSAAIRDLDPLALVGLTATPAKSDLSKVIYQYPLARAIADKYVKTPVLVGRTDTADSVEVRLRDGLTLLRAKQKAADAYADAHGLPRVNAVMFVVADSIDSAQAVSTVLRRPGMYEHDYEQRVLVVHSKAADDALARLAAVEEPDSPVRVIVSVDMLKEGWDVKNIYVICSLRPSISDVLTEQTLGRGLRLPWGAYTGVELLDTVEVLSHERYESLLAKAGVLLEGLVENRVVPVPTDVPGTTRVVDIDAPDADGHAPAPTDVPVQPTDAETTVLVPTGTATTTCGGGSGATPAGGVPGSATTSATTAPAPAAEPGSDTVTPVPVSPSEEATGGATITSMTERLREAEQQAQSTIEPVAARRQITMPIVERTVIARAFSLSDVDERLFTALGKQIADTAGGGQLARKRLDVIEDPTSPTGLRLVPADAADIIDASTPELPLGNVVSSLKSGILAMEFIDSARRSDGNAARRLADALVAGAGGADHVAPYVNQTLAAVQRLLRQQYRAADEVVDLSVTSTEFGPTRTNSRPVELNRYSPFSRGVAYNSWSERGLHKLNWFDSETERRFANLLDSDTGVTVWARIQRGEFVVEWEGAGTAPTSTPRSAAFTTCSRSRATTGSATRSCCASGPRPSSGPATSPTTASTATGSTCWYPSMW